MATIYECRCTKCGETVIAEWDDLEHFNCGGALLLQGIYSKN